jgi:hypothetical protein
MTDLSKMNDLINKLSDEPFKYGKSDCYTFATKLVKAWHGKDYTKLHAVYKNKKEADRYMHEFNGIEALTTGTLGYSVPPELCESGDMVSAEVSSGQVALGFVFNGFGYFKTKKKPVRIPLENCRRGWRIK